MHVKSRSLTKSRTGGGGEERERGCVLRRFSKRRGLWVSQPWTRSFRTQLVFYFKREKGRQGKQMFLRGWQLVLVMSITFCGKHPHPKGFMITSQLLQVRMKNAFWRSLTAFFNHDSFTANSSLSLMGCGRRAGICKKARAPQGNFFFPPFGA